MAITAEELRILVRAETKQARREFDRFRKTSKDTSLDLKALAKQLIGPLSVTAGFALAGRAVKDFVSSGIKFNAQIEQLGVAFSSILGSTSAANSLVDELKEFSSATPFQMMDLAKGTQVLLGFGTEAKDVVATMRDLGNAAMGDQGKLDRLVEAYGKLQSKGKASLEELNRFTEAGVPIMQALQEQLGLTKEELSSYISTGKLGFEEVNTALQSMTRGEGKLAGILEGQSKTLSGIMSTFKDNVTNAAAELTKTLIPTLTIALQKMNEILSMGNAKRQLEDVFDTMFAPLELGENANNNLEAAFGALTDLQLARNEINRILAMKSRGLRTTETAFTGGKSKDELRAVLREMNTFIDDYQELYMRLLGGVSSGMTITRATETGEAVGTAIAEGMWAGMTEFKWAMENDYFFDPEKWVSKLTDGFTGLDEGGPKPFDAVAFAASIVPQGIGNMNPEDFQVPALTGDFDDLGNAVGSANEAFRKYYEYVQLLGSIDVPIVQPMIDAMNELTKSVEREVLSAALGSMTSTLAELGSMMVYMGESSQDMTTMLLAQLSGLSSNLSSVFLAAAVKAFLDPLIPFEVGAGLLALAGISALGSGIFGGLKSRSSGGSSSSYTPSPPDRGSTYTGDTVTINYNGDVFTNDEREATTLATVRAGGGNR